MSEILGSIMEHLLGSHSRAFASSHIFCMDGVRQFTFFVVGIVSWVQRAVLCSFILGLQLQSYFFAKSALGPEITNTNASQHIITAIMYQLIKCFLPKWSSEILLHLVYAVAISFMLIITATKVKQILEYIKHLKAAFEMITSIHKSKKD